MRSIRSHRLDRLLTAVTSTRTPGLGRMVELTLFAVTAPLLGVLLFPHDPLGLGAGFPWLIIGPVVFAARYGIGAGVGCVTFAVLVLALSTTVLSLPTIPIAGLAIGTMILAVIVGDAASSWRRRSLQAEAENGYLRHRLKEFSNDYHVLKVSHGQLEEFMAGQRLSLRRALQQIEPTLASGGNGLGSSVELMAVFAQFCSVQVAGLYAMKSDALVDVDALATHGDMGELPVFDPLLRLAIAERKLVSVRLDSAAANQHESGLIAVVPIVDSRDRLHGLLAIRDMHFMAFQQENLNVLALLASFVGDRIARGGGLGDTPGDRFMAELDSALRFSRSHAVPAALVVLEFRADRQTVAVAEFVSSAVRSLDSAWIPPSNGSQGQTKVAVLMPLVGELGCRAWLARVDRAVREEFSTELSSLLLGQRVLPLQRSLTRVECLAFVRDGPDSSHGVDLRLDDPLSVPAAEGEFDNDLPAIDRVA